MTLPGRELTHGGTQRGVGTRLLYLALSTEGMNKQRNDMNDTKQFKHGEEGTHYACQEMLKKYGGKTGCCRCNNHECKETNSENKQRNERKR